MTTGGYTLERGNCQVEPLEKPVDEDAPATAEAAYLAVTGMGCPNCALRVRNGLLLTDGVLVAEVSLGRSLAAVAFDPQVVTPPELERAVADAGNDGRHQYRAQVVRVMPASDSLIA